MALCGLLCGLLGWLAAWAAALRGFRPGLVLLFTAAREGVGGSGLEAEGLPREKIHSP